MQLRACFAVSLSAAFAKNPNFASLTHEKD